MPQSHLFNAMFIILRAICRLKLNTKKNRNFVGTALVDIVNNKKLRAKQQQQQCTHNTAIKTHRFVHEFIYVSLSISRYIYNFIYYVRLTCLPFNKIPTVPVDI